MHHIHIYAFHILNMMQKSYEPQRAIDRSRLTVCSFTVEYVDDEIAVSLASLDEDAKLLFVEGCTSDRDNDNPTGSLSVSLFLIVHMVLLYWFGQSNVFATCRKNESDHEKLRSPTIGCPSRHELVSQPLKMFTLGFLVSLLG